MRFRRARWNFAWNGLLGMAMMTMVSPLFWPQNFGPTSWRTSQFSEWEVSTALHPHLLDGIYSTGLVEPQPDDLWIPPKKNFTACDPSTRPLPTSPMEMATEGYLQVFLEGGLNQQRMGVCDAVAVAKMLNVTLVVPHFDRNSVWKDKSMFADIFDLEHFVRSLENDVHIVTELPPKFGWSTRRYYASGFRVTRIKDAPTHAGLVWYRNRVLPVIREHGIAAIAPFTHRLGFEGVPPAILRLRCRVNFEALRFKPSLRSLGDLIVQRLHGTAPWNFTGINHDSIDDTDDGKDDIKSPYPAKYLALHLRFDKDMAAHSNCAFGGGRAEERALSRYRRDVWRGKVSNHLFSSDENRESGKCPLTPEEVAITLTGLGFRPDTLLYLASYKVYGGESRMAHLRNLFPFVLDKYRLTTDAEIEPFKGMSSQLAALDYHVSLHSDAFMSASRGNMHNALVGHRAYAIDGLTIRPDMVLLAHLLGNRSVTWNDFQDRVRAGHKLRMGQLNMRKPLQSIYAYPAPDCMCSNKKG